MADSPGAATYSGMLRSSFVFACLVAACSPAREALPDHDASAPEPLPLDAAPPDIGEPSTVDAPPIDAGVVSSSAPAVAPDSGGATSSSGEPTDQTQGDDPCESPCGVDERCSAANCVQSDNWLTAEATLRTPDGQRHTFAALSESLAVSCSGDTCVVTLAPLAWTASDLGGELLPSDASVTFTAADEGGIELGECPLAVLRNAPELTLSDPACLVTVSDMTAWEGGGYLRGTLFARANVTHAPDAGSDAGGVGSFTVRGEFQVTF